MRVILYARFSPRPNAAECESSESQLAEMRGYCRGLEYEVVGEYQDRALSGGDNWEDRPGMLDAVTKSRRGMVFLVRSYDRLFRDTDKAMLFRAMLEAQGVDVRSVTEPAANGDGMNAKLIRFIFLWIAEYQRELIRARTKAKMLQHQSMGRRMSDRTPWGWERNPKNPAFMVKCQEEQEVASWIMELHQDGMSLRAIGRELERAGIQRRGKSYWPHEIIKRIIVRYGAR